MNNNDIIQYLKTEFYPVTLATPDETLVQIIQNAKRYFNTHSAYPVVKMFSASTGDYVLQLTPEYKNVYQVYPSSTPDWILQNYPLWSLLGITIIDNLTSDLIMLSETYRNYRYYMGTDFRWKFEKSEDPSVGPKLYMSNLPSNTTGLCVVGSYRLQSELDFTSNEVDIKSEYILQWLLEYCKALVKLVEGNTLRKTEAIGIKNDGQQLVDEGKKEKDDLEKKLAIEGRWTTFCRRF